MDMRNIDRMLEFKRIKKASQYVLETYQDIINEIIFIYETDQLDSSKHKELCRQLNMLHKYDIQERGLSYQERRITD